MKSLRKIPELEHCRARVERRDSGLKKIGGGKGLMPVQYEQGGFELTGAASQGENPPKRRGNHLHRDQRKREKKRKIHKSWKVLTIADISFQGSWRSLAYGEGSIAFRKENRQTVGIRQGESETRGVRGERIVIWEAGKGGPRG